jgi:hypothetical protein
VKVAAREARGAVTISPKWHCKHRRNSGSHGVRESEDPDSTILSAVSKQGGRSFIALGLQAPELKNPTLFSASTVKVAGSLLVFHSTSVIGGARTFSFDDGLTAATVEPPAPFYGSAAFQRNADNSTSWTGTLHVFMPGVGDVRLAGPSYETKLEHPKSTSGPGSVTVTGG